MDLNKPFKDPWDNTFVKLNALRKKYRKHFSYEELDKLLNFIYEVTKERAVIFRMSHCPFKQAFSPYLIEMHLKGVPKNVQLQSLEEFFEKNIVINIRMKLKKDKRALLQEFAVKASWVMFLGHIGRLAYAGVYCYEHFSLFADILQYGMPIFDAHMVENLKGRIL